MNVFFHDAFDENSLEKNNTALKTALKCDKSIP